MAIPSEPSDPFTNCIFESRGLPSVANGVPSQRVDDYFSFALANGGYPMHTSSVLLRREQLIDCGLFAVGKSMGEDIDTWCRLAFRGSFQYVARPSATYRERWIPAPSPATSGEKLRFRCSLSGCPI